MIFRLSPPSLLLCLALAGDSPIAAARAAANETGSPVREAPAASVSEPARWREERRIIDLHQHVNSSPAHLARAVRIMDAAGVGIGVNLSGGTVIPKAEGQLSEFERVKGMADELFPGRFIHYMNLDYTGWDEPGFSEKAVKQVEEGRRLGAAGLKEYKRLGLFLRDSSGKLLKIDDPKLDPVWKRCGELNMPVSIHVADPRAFWRPFEPSNERWEELKDHKSWWFGDSAKYPAREELLEALNRVIARHPGTTFVCVHFANNAEDLEWVEKTLDRFPNMMADIAARVPEIGRHDPDKVHRLFVKHQDRILFATDFMVYDRLILGSGGDAERPTEADAVAFYNKHWRWFETRDRGFPHMTPIQGSWTIDAIGLPPEVLRKIYFDNARKLLARSLPPPKLTAARLAEDFHPAGDLSHPAWRTAAPVTLEYQSNTGEPAPKMATAVRALWSDKYLYLGYSAPFTELTVFEPARRDERIGLWEKDVVEAFIGTDPENIRSYAEFQVAPNGERLDLKLNLPERDFAWDSGFATAVKVNDAAKVWTAEMRIPLSALAAHAPRPGARWRINLLRCDYANNAFLAWNPAGTGTFHVPEKFGVLELAP